MLCRKCGCDRAASEFRRRNGKILMPCKKCYLEYGRRHYQNNKQYYKDKAKKRDAAQGRIVRDQLWQYLLEHPCIDCGNNDPRVLDFDHVRGTKRYNIGDTKRQRFSWEALLQEIEKCEIRCANCHRIKTHSQLNYYKPDTAL